MKKAKVNLLENGLNKAFKKEPKKKWPFYLKITIYVLAIFLIFGLSFSYKVISSTTENITSGKGKTSFFQQLKFLFTNRDRQIEGEKEDRVNILLLGMGGEGHSGMYLTDTIILASLKLSTNQLAMLSIPRDLVVPLDEYGWRKINNANALGNSMNYPGGGEAYARDKISEVLDQPIHYYGRVDFDGFREIIDFLGGVDILVERSFTDYQYPTYDYGWQTISFKQGWETMGGERALKFVRSRHGTSGEGSDFARSKRQQKVLTALKGKLLSFETLVNPKKLVDIFNSLGEHVRTDMQTWEIVRLSSLIKKIDFSNIITRVLDTGPDGPLYAQITAEGAYILSPKTEDFGEIQAIATHIFSWEPQEIEEAKIIVQNGTQIDGLAQKTAEMLQAADFEVVKIGNASRQDYEKTVIYDFTCGQKPQALAALKTKLSANVSTLIPAYLQETKVNFSNLDPSINFNAQALDNDSPAFDFLVVIGQNASKIQNNNGQQVSWQR